MHHQPPISPGEPWRDIPDFDNYCVSSFGRVWSRPRYGTRGGLMTACPDSHGYPMVCVRAGGHSYTRNVHILVARAFIGPKPPGQEVRHLDGDRTNPRLDNLVYGSRSENQRDAVRHGMQASSRKTHCPQGHEYTPDNLIKRTTPNVRSCLTCNREHMRSKRARDPNYGKRR